MHWRPGGAGTHRAGCPDLSPATGSTADRHGSNTNKIRTSRPLPGLCSDIKSERRQQLHPGVLPIAVSGHASQFSILR